MYLILKGFKDIILGQISTWSLNYTKKDHRLWQLDMFLLRQALNSKGSSETNGKCYRITDFESESYLLQSF